MWRPAVKTSGTNDVPLANKRRFGLPEEAPPPPNAPPHASRPPADLQFFNGRQERAPRDEAPPRRDDRRDDRDYGRGGGDYGRRDDYRRDDRDRERRYDDYPPRDAGRDPRSSRWDEPRREPEPQRGRSRDREEVEDGPRKRRSRWGDADARVNVPGMPVTVMGNMSGSQLDNYAIHVRLEEINRKLRTGDVVPPDGQRSPSPPPNYDSYGRRTNTRELRYRKKLEDERAKLVARAAQADPSFRPPVDFQRRGGNRPQDKVYIPVKEFPEINFFGLLVGPRGNSLKKMERESGAKISIRGKGSVKEGKGRAGHFPNDEEDELHCLITGDSEAVVKSCVALINRVIETAASTPEGENDHKRNQLRELASLNGTLRDDENQLCQNCGEKGHRRWECPAQRVYSANVICRLCGGAGHMARDCRGRGDPNLQQNKQTAFDSEYTALMAELGEGGGGGGGGPPMGAIGAAPGQGNIPPESRVPPWRQPENWQTNAGGYRGPPGYQPPQQGQGWQQPAAPGGQAAYAGYGGYQQGAAAGAADPYAAYYASMGQQAPTAA
ncbi:branchpoint-bridging protein [Cryptococcus amylolentus CBS 6039]|uniref:Branchpoint-bridging protein n=2 Tax=Cryptococcus amylolentus TaxID=104669 RepID=A0A1E3I034_9TREE|nr:branchpoint-bridging protein [Cryptococcus amylolentus CBS 6039]ODN81685.1 branchpoint-bridging protein [Cryptococcus amylolentus CBS 6039]ODO10109.1 branchpoint-bridging protein [Cryptococcus amylolentus CBS 6273]